MNTPIQNSVARWMGKWQQWWINSAWDCQNTALESINKTVLKTDRIILSYIPFQSRDANEATSLCTMTLTHCVLTPVRSWTGMSASTQLPFHRSNYNPKWKKHEFSCWIMIEVNLDRQQSYVIPVIRYLWVFVLDSLLKTRTWGFDWGLEGKGKGCWNEGKAGEI